MKERSRSSSGSPSTAPAAPGCDRVTCSRPATVLLVFDPQRAEAWLSDLEAAGRAVGITLCLDHANRVTVPSGWTLNDDRSAHNRVPGRAGRSGSRAAKSKPPRLASVAAIAADEDTDRRAAAAADDAPEDEAPEPAEAEATGPGEATDRDDPTDGGPDETTADALPADRAPSDEEDAAAGDPPQLWSDEPDALDVDDSTPMLSRAFRAAHID